MNVTQFLTTKLQKLRIDLDPEELAVLIEKRGLKADDEYGIKTERATFLVIANLLPTLLLSPDISEGGYSEKWNKEDLKLYYAMLCRTLGIENEIEAAAGQNVRDKSHLW